jgi:hypothetical protein
LPFSYTEYQLEKDETLSVYSGYAGVKAGSPVQRDRFYDEESF